jgi:hypothetical protein
MSLGMIILLNKDMKGGEVHLSKERYEELLKKEQQLLSYEDNLLNNKELITVKCTEDFFGHTEKFIELYPTKDDLINELIKVNENLNKSILRAHDGNKRYLNTIAQMNLIDFVIWRRDIKKK